MTVHPEDALDLLLTERAHRRQGASRATSLTHQAGPTQDSLRPLVEAAARLDALADATPSAAFSASLEQRLMSRMQAHATQPERSMRAAISPVGAASSARPAARPARGWTGALRGRSHPAWAGIAAALLLTIGLGVFTAQAAPGQPLYTVRQLAQHMAAQAFPSPTASEQDALARAQTDLAAYNAAISRGDVSGALAALRALRGDDAEATTLAQSLSDPSARQAASQQIGLFHQTAAADLRQSLAALSWQGRAQVTDALRAWGDTSLVVNSARVLNDSSNADQGQHGSAGGATALVQIMGAGFADGTLVLVNGQPDGSLIALSPTTITARIPASDLSEDNVVIAVEESDGTVAVAARTDRGDNGQPGASGTPGSGDHKGDQGGAGSSDTPSANSTRTPNPDATNGPSSN